MAVDPDKPLPITPTDNLLGATPVVQPPRTDKPNFLGVHDEPVESQISATVPVLINKRQAQLDADKLLRPKVVNPRTESLTDAIRKMSRVTKTIADLGTPRPRSIAGGGLAQERVLQNVQTLGEYSQGFAHQGNLLLASIDDFQKKTASAYMRKDLAQGAQTVSMLKAIMETTQQSAITMEAKLEAIKLNTGASDAKKVTLADRVREALIRDTVNKGSKFAVEKLTKFAQNTVAGRWVPQIRQGLADNWDSSKGLVENIGNVSAATGVAVKKELRVRALQKERNGSVASRLRKGLGTNYLYIHSAGSTDPTLVYAGGTLITDSDIQNSAMQVYRSVWNAGQIHRAQDGVSAVAYGKGGVALTTVLASGETISFFRGMYKPGDGFGVVSQLSDQLKALGKAVDTKNVSGLLILLKATEAHASQQTLTQDNARDAAQNIRQGLKQTAKTFSDVRRRIRDADVEDAAQSIFRSTLSGADAGLSIPSSLPTGQDNGPARPRKRLDLSALRNRARSNLNAAGQNVAEQLTGALSENSIPANVSVPPQITALLPDANPAAATQASAGTVSRIRDSLGRMKTETLERLRLNSQGPPAPLLGDNVRDALQNAQASQDDDEEKSLGFKESLLARLRQVEEEREQQDTERLTNPLEKILARLQSTFGSAPLQRDTSPNEDLLGRQKIDIDAVDKFHRSFTDWVDLYKEDQLQLISLLEEIRDTRGFGGGGMGDGTGEPGIPKGGSRIARAVDGTLRIGGKVLKTGAGLYTKALFGIARGSVGAVAAGGRLAAQMSRKYVDVYRRDQLAQRVPLVTRRQLKDGLVIARTGKPVKHVNEITEPIIDPRTGNEVVTQDDIDAGLVDINGTKVTRRGGAVGGALTLGGNALRMTASAASRVGNDLAIPALRGLGGLYTSMFKSATNVVGGLGKFLGNSAVGLMTGKGIGRVAGGAASVAGSLAGMYGTLFKVGGTLAMAGIKTAGGLLGNLFGFNKGGKGMLNRKDVEELVADRLDDIYKLLQLHFSESEKKTAGDVDGDGVREGSAADRANEIEKERKARLERQETARGRKLFGGGGSVPGGKGGLAALLGMGGGLAAGGGSAAKAAGVSDGEEKGEDDDGSLVGDLATTAAGGWLANKFPGVTAAGKRVGGKVMRGLGKGGRLLAGAGRGALGLAGGAAGLAGGVALGGAKLAGRGALGSAKLLKGGVMKALSSSVGKSVLKKIPLLGLVAGAGFAIQRALDGDLVGAGGELLSGLVSLVPFIGTAASVAIDTWLGYRDFKSSDPYAALIRERMRAYGIDDEDLYGLMITVEKTHLKILEGKRSRYSLEDYAALAEKFGFDPEDKNQVDYFASWYNNRFTPIFMAHNSFLEQLGKDYASANDMSPEEVEATINSLIKVSTHRIQRYEKVKPTPEAYQELLGQPESDPKTRSLSSQKKPDDQGFDPAAPIGNVTDKPKPASVLAQWKMPASTINRNGTGLMQASFRMPTDPTTNPDDPSVRDQRIATAVNNNLPSRNGRPQPAVYTPGASVSAPGAHPGVLSAKYESRDGGSIGFDRNGGTSYGKYQLSSAQGTFQDFLKWLATQGPEGADIVRQINSAGNTYNTGSKNGEVPDAWRRLAKSTNLTAYEEAYIKKTHYDDNLSGLSQEIQDRIAKSPALQAAWWSTTVQHGPKSVAIWEKNYDPSDTTDSYLRKIYDYRGTQFGSSTPETRQSVLRRFARESEDAIAMATMESQPEETPDDKLTGIQDPLADIRTHKARTDNPLLAPAPEDAPPSDPNALATARLPAPRNIPAPTPSPSGTVAPATPSPLAQPVDPVAAATAMSQERQRAETLMDQIAEKAATQSSTLKQNAQNGGAADLRQYAEQLIIQKKLLETLTRLEETTKAANNRDDVDRIVKGLEAVNKSVSSGASLAGVEDLLEKALQKPNQVNVTGVNVTPPASPTPGRGQIPQGGISLQRARSA